MSGSRRSGYVLACGLALAVLTASRAGAQLNLPATPLPPLPQVSPLPGQPDQPPAPPTVQPAQPQNPAAILPTPGPGPQLAAPPVPAPTQPRFNLTIAPKTPVKDLLPTAPKAAPITGPVVADDLTRVPEIEFQAKPAKVTTDDELTKQAAFQLAKINHLNAKKTDAFMTALLENRPDLAGVPFVMGDDCRATGARVQHFAQAAETVRRALGGAPVPVTPQTLGGFSRANRLPTPPTPAPTQQIVEQTFTVQGTTGTATVMNFVPAQPPAPSFWQQYATLCEQEDAARTRPDKETTEHVTTARLAALTQILAAESAEIRLGLVKYLTGVPHVEATRALARMAIFSPEDDIRAAAITALKVRREKDYTETLVKGLRYPWPAVARHAADTIAKLERADLLPELVRVLESSDPRLPETKEVDGQVTVREMVKLNHHRNCMMCHTAAGSGTPNPNALQAEVAVQGQPLPSPGEGYRQSTPELMIRIDVTYLRPDFSAAMPVRDAHPWPEMQRFDFLVRERKLTADEAVRFREGLTPKGAGVLSPYHKAALAALREMTGKDTAPTAEAWRKLLELRTRD